MNLLVTGAFKGTEEQFKILEDIAGRVIFMQDERGDLPCSYGEVDAVLCNGLFLYHPIEKFSSLKYIQLTSAGLDRVPMGYVEKAGIEIHSATGVYSIPMAEFALYGVLSLYKKGRFFMENQAECRWEKHRGLTELYGKTVCVIGCGSVGREVLKRFKAFGCKTVGVDLAGKEDELFGKIYPTGKLKEALALCDIVVLTLPLTDDTRHLINADAFEVMRKGAVLVNIARGGIVDTDALKQALKTKLGGAVLDVFEEEPLKSEDELWKIENVIITPHNSFVGNGNNQRLFDVIVKNLKKED